MMALRALGIGALVAFMFAAQYVVAVLNRRAR